MKHSSTVTAATCLVAAVQYPVLSCICITIALLLLATVIGAAALSRKKYRRAAACRVLELVLDAVSRNRLP